MPHNSAHLETIRQLDQAVAEVFAIMLDLACIPAPGEPPPAPCYIASVAFSGTLQGSCAVHLTPASAAELTSSLTGIPLAQVPDDLCADTVAELCNMIAGSWKTRQPTREAACQLSCPTVTLGGPGASDPGYALLYGFDCHRLSLHFALK